MIHLSHIIKGENVPEFTKKEVELYKRTFHEVHLPVKKFKKFVIRYVNTTRKVTGCREVSI